VQGTDTLKDPKEHRQGTFTGLAPGAWSIQDRTMRPAQDPADSQLVVPVVESVVPTGEEGSGSVSAEGIDEGAQLGPRFGPYEILRVIARGGRATVYLAVRRGSSEPIAIKVLKRSVARSPEHRAGILKEAQAAVGIDAPNVLKLLDVGVIQDQIYLAMRYIDGWSLKERLESGDVPDLAESLRIAREVARGLGAASLLSLVHRDVKPDNIMIARDGSVLLTDFGLATARGHGRSSGLVAGSPGYVSPEQALGQPVDVRSDLYSLGATLFELVTGRTMYIGRTDVSVITKHIHEPPPKLATIRPSLPAPVITLVMRLVDKSPANRFQSAAELVSALDGILGEVRRTEPRPQDAFVGVVARAAIGSALMVLLSILLPMLIEWIGHISWERTRALLDTSFLGAGGAVVALVLLAALGLVRRGELPLPGSTAWLVRVKEATGAVGAALLVAGAVLGPPAVMNMIVSIIAVAVLSSWIYGILLRRQIARLRPDRGIGHVLAVLGDPRLERWRLVHAPLLTTLAFLATVHFALLAYFQAARLG
jgi:serine/threonine-protein kinase